MADLRIPVSPIHGTVNTVGDATHGPFIQLANPVGSGVTLRVYELFLGATIASGTSRIRMQRTATPSTLGGTITTANSFRRDETNTSTILATLKGCTAVATALFAEANGWWFDRLNADSQSTYQQSQILRPQSFPLIIKAGSALEIANPDASATNALRAYIVWDEV